MASTVHLTHWLICAQVKDGETVVASFYLDPYSRPADKRGGAWMDVCVGKSKALKRDVPTAYLTCNGSPPVGDKPSLMPFDEVNTLYHEMGHGLQHMLTKVEDGDAAAFDYDQYLGIRNGSAVVRFLLEPCAPCAKGSHTHGLSGAAVCDICEPGQVRSFFLL